MTMTKLRLLAIMPREVAEQVEAAAPVAGLQIVPALDLACVLCEKSGGLLSRLRKTELARELVEFQRALEALMPFGPLLPAASGSVFENRIAAAGFLVAHAAMLREALREYGLKQQFTVAIRWDPKAMLLRLRASERFAPVAAVDRAKDPRSFATTLARVMEEWRAELARDFAASLRAGSIETLVLPSESDNVVLNATVLIDPAAQGAFDAALEAIDATATEALAIKVAGPLPACAFASVRVEQPDRRRVAEASRTLGVSPQAGLDNLKRLYRERMRQVHPDLQAGHEDEAASAKTAYDLLKRIAEAEAALAAEGMRPDTAVPLARLLRADAADLAA